MPLWISKVLKTVSIVSSSASFMTSSLSGFSLTAHRLFISLLLKTVKIVRIANIDMEIFALCEGSYSVDSSQKFIPLDPQTDSAKDRPGSLFIHVNPFLVKTAYDLILFDAGLGFKDTRDELILHQHIRNAGFDPDEVTLVLMSHLHYDHSGGLVTERNGKLEPSFPGAEHVI